METFPGGPADKTEQLGLFEINAIGRIAMWDDMGCYYTEDSNHIEVYPPMEYYGLLEHTSIARKGE